MDAERVGDPPFHSPQGDHVNTAQKVELRQARAVPPAPLRSSLVGNEASRHPLRNNVGFSDFSTNTEARPADDALLFRSSNGDGNTLDDHELDLDSRDAVMLEVARILVDVARDELPQGDGTEISVSVRSEFGKPITVATLTVRNSWLA